MGTNDVVNDPEETVRKGFEELIKLARNKFPEARIYMSSIFGRQRKNDNLNQPINALNLFLEELCDRTPLMTLMDNSNIWHKHMRDPRHVNATGFYIFLTNIRLIVFGETYSSLRADEW